MFSTSCRSLTAQTTESMEKLTTMFVFKSETSFQPFSTKTSLRPSLPWQTGQSGWDEVQAHLWECGSQTLKHPPGLLALFVYQLAFPSQCWALAGARLLTCCLLQGALIRVGTVWFTSLHPPHLSVGPQQSRCSAVWLNPPTNPQRGDFFRFLYLCSRRGITSWWSICRMADVIKLQSLCYPFRNWRVKCLDRSTELTTSLLQNPPTMGKCISCSKQLAFLTEMD